MLKVGDRVRLISVKEIQEQDAKYPLNTPLALLFKIGDIGTVTKTSSYDNLAEVQFKVVSILVSNEMVEVINSARYRIEKLEPIWVSYTNKPWTVTDKGLQQRHFFFTFEDALEAVTIAVNQPRGMINYAPRF